MTARSKAKGCAPESIAEIAQSTLNVGEFRSAVLDLLRVVTGSDSAVWSDVPDVTHCRRTPAFAASSIACPPTSASTLRLYDRDPQRYDDAQGLHRARLFGGVATDAQIFTQAERDSLPLFIDILKPAGIRTYIVCLVEFHGRPLSRIALSRHFTGSRFADRDLRVLKHVRLSIGMAEAAFGAVTNAAPCGAAPCTELSRSLTLSLGISGSEHQVLELMERGLSNVEIARLLSRSPNTVRNTLVKAFRKLGVSRRAEAVYMLRTL